MRIMSVYKQGTANAAYRAVLPLRALERRGHTIYWPSREGTLLSYLERRAPEWDVTHIQQLTDPHDVEAVRRLRAAGAAVVWDTDDDMSQVPRNSPVYHRFGGRKGVARLFETTVELARTVNLMTTPSEHLAALYRGHGAEHVKVIENYLDGHEIARPRRRHPGVVIGVCSGFEHAHDHKKLKLAKTLKAILARHEGVRVVALGRDLALGGPRYTHITRVPFERLLEVERGFDIGLAPLVDSGMARGRSNVKLKEYATAGAMWLASPVGPYAGMGEEQGGLLVGPGDWLGTLDALVTDHARRVALAERARAWVRGETIERHAAEWERAFRGAIARARAGRLNAVPS